ncbi:hemerythrin domain-containing protein [Paludibacter sp. 221]|uniref:hemerythrin domain-containing protein n=1 Tax=Paludibacter sp. 221 TaxID=2302939 RepID=UPI0013D10965|nr:hemerythrin domain-containing protein [Paludibacter sp. 221]NDV46488.1 hemerythrin domain-containing protein [Paludibacter sp. 221]
MLQGKFLASQKMNELINEDTSLLLVISRFGLPLGFENKTVEEICNQHGVDTYTFLSVVNFLSEENFEMDNSYEKISIESLISFLKNGHQYFLGFKLPAIRNKLLSAIELTEPGNAYKDIFLKFFDDYVEEVNSHMSYEDEVVFPYVLELLKGDEGNNYNIQVFEDRHNQIDQKMMDLKNILIKYYPSKGNSNLLIDVLMDVLSCSKELSQHNKVEDYMFIPAIEAIENKNRSTYAK